MPSEDKLTPLQRKDLWEKYEGKDKLDKISRYLQHCTEQRVDGKSWNVGEMFADIDPVIEEFENLLPNKKRSWNTTSASKTRLTVLSQTSMSTATVSRGSSVTFTSGLIRRT